MATVKYSPWDGQDGIRLQDGRLSAWVDGVEVASVSSINGGLNELLDGFVVPRYFPDLNFACGDPSEMVMNVDLYDALVTPRNVHGVIEHDGTRFSWSAFLANDRLTRIRTEELSPGVPRRSVLRWVFNIPGQLTLDDPIIEHRLMINLERLLVDLQADREVHLPLVLSISNVFDSRTLPPEEQTVIGIQEHPPIDSRY